MSFAKKIYYWLPTLAWMGLIYYLSSYHAITASVVSWQDFTIKKSAHVIIYFVFAVWVYRSLKFTTPLTKTKLIFWTIVFVAVYAASDEIHQSFVPTRNPALRDVLIDVIGASVGTWWVANVVYRQHVI